MVRPVVYVAVLLAAGVHAQTIPGPVDLPKLAAEAARRFPQPVRVGDLLGADVLKPVEAQPVLGHVVAVTRRLDGGLAMIVRYGGVLGLGARRVAVPVEALALLHPYVALVGLAPGQLDRLPTVADPAAGALPADAVIAVGVVRPFH